MSSFEFLSVLISVVVGLAIANVLTGIGRLLHRHREVRLSAAFVMWTLIISFYMVIYWWTVVFGWRDWEHWNLLIFLFVLTYGTILFLLSVILYPTDMPASWDPHGHFIDMRKWFFGLFIVLAAVEFTDSWLKSHLEGFSTPYLLMLAIWIGGGIVGWNSTSRRIHAIVAACIFVSLVSWVAYQLRDLEWVLS